MARLEVSSAVPAPERRELTEARCALMGANQRLERERNARRPDPYLLEQAEDNYARRMRDAQSALRAAEVSR